MPHAFPVFTTPREGTCTLITCEVGKIENIHDCCNVGMVYFQAM